MAEYTLTIRIDGDRVKQFNTNGYKLCVAGGVEANGKINYNVVGYATTCAAIVNVTWKEEYSIAASQDAFSGGSKSPTLNTSLSVLRQQPPATKTIPLTEKFEISTTPQPIQFGSSYILPKDWTDQVPNHSADAPPAGFLFINKTPAASCIVYKKINGALNPIYISAAGPLVPGREALVPKTSITVWFQAASSTGTMISQFDTDNFVVDFTGGAARSIKYDSEGAWSNVN
ncbi:hypothetical protein G7046_g7485 [Stylonectria norvegica]|nr:hypothetical protein G7046_g7485 [Stylonectria norvegica]